MCAGLFCWASHGKRLHTDCTPAAPLGCLVCEGVYQMLPASRFRYLCVHLSPSLTVLYSKGLLHFSLLLFPCKGEPPHTHTHNVLSDLSTFAAIVSVF